MFLTTFISLLHFAGKSLLLQAAAIIIGTFILEDAATVIAAMQAQQGLLSVPLALGALYAGIVLGDLGLYAAGRWSAHADWIAKRLPPHRRAAMQAYVARDLARLVLVSRFVPGMRLPTYTTCGFVRADLRIFTGAVVAATSIWTSLLFFVSMRAGGFLMHYLGAWRWAGAIGLALSVVLLGRIAASGLQGARQ